jgi:stage V sporulation protein SpoVS
LVESINEGDKAIVVLDQTSFYAESGDRLVIPAFLRIKLSDWVFATQKTTL